MNKKSFLSILNVHLVRSYVNKLPENALKGTKFSLAVWSTEEFRLLQFYIAYKKCKFFIY